MNLIRGKVPMSVRHLITVCAVGCACFLMACGSGAGDKSSLSAQPEATGATLDSAVFAFTPAEQAALAKDDDSALGVQFGDPALGPVSFEAPPADTRFAGIRNLPVSDTRSASNAKNKGGWDWSKKCKKHG